jgi:hypothetical protein
MKAAQRALADFTCLMADSLRPPQSFNDLFVRVLILLKSSRNDPFRVGRKLAVQRPRSERLERAWL